MDLKTVLRAFAWIGVVATGWALNIAWEHGVGVRAAAPPQFERHVVGAAMLAAACAIAIALCTGSRRRPVAAVAAMVLGAAAHGIAWWIRSLATGTGQEQLLDGPGWKWVAVGTALVTVTGVVAGARVLMSTKPAAAETHKRRRRS